MSDPVLKRRDGTRVQKRSIAALQQCFRGQVVQPCDKDYETARRVWNASIDRRPGLIARCLDAADVALAVQFAAANNVLVAVRGGGHNVAGRGTCDHGLVIDLSPMNAVAVDPEQRLVRVQGGALLGDVDAATAVHGLAVPSGVVSKTGMAGLTLGGGTGWLSRKYGLTCDNLLSCEIVTAAGQLVNANTETNPDLLWGLRGGGGNFGIATTLVYRAYPVARVLGGLVVHPRDQAGAVLRHYRDFMTNAPNELTAYAGLLTMPDGVPVVGVLACYCGDLDEGQRVLAPLRGFGSPLADMIQPMPFVEFQKLADQNNPDNTHNYWKSVFLHDLNDDAIDCIIAHANRIRSPLSYVVVQLLGGAVARLSEADTAFVHRKVRYCVGIEAKWRDTVETRKHVAWARSFWDTLSLYATPGYLPNFVGDEPPDVVREAFGRNYPRLVDLKTKYDPTNFFSLNLNVPPRACAPAGALAPER